MRASGNTFRAIMKALLAASGGEDVILVSTNHSRSESKAEMARRVMREFGSLELDKGTRLTINFINGKRIYFVGERDLVDGNYGPRLRGVSDKTLVVFDIE